MMQPSVFIADDKFSDVIALATQRGLERRPVDTNITEHDCALLWRNLVATDHKLLHESHVSQMKTFCRAFMQCALLLCLSSISTRRSSRIFFIARFETHEDPLIAL
jgi:hypothetical protein